jgi:hypothetical protein
MAKEPPSVAESVALLCSRIEALIATKTLTNPQSRVLIALAGVPGSGKSTISSALIKELPARGIDCVTVLPMVRAEPTHLNQHSALMFPRMAFITPKLLCPPSTIQKPHFAAGEHLLHLMAIGSLNCFVN